MVARAWRLTSFGIFGDEVFTLWTSAQSWSNVLRSVVEDVVHPPLFYSLLKAWIDIGGQSLLWLKILPLTLSVASLVPFFLLCREMKINKTATALALWLIAVSSFVINHAQESRMYSLLLLLVLCSLWLFVKLQSTERRRAGLHFALFSVNVLLVFTHYFGWAIIGLEFIFLLFWQRRHLLFFVLSAVAVAIVFSPWVYLVIGAARANPTRATFFWNHPPPISDLIGFYGNLNGPLSYSWKIFGTALVLLLFALPIAIQSVRLLRNQMEGEQATRFRFLLLFAFVPVIVAFTASHLLPQSVWAFRYLIISAPAYFLLVAVSIDDLKPARFRIVMFVLIAGWAGISGFTEMLNRDLINWEPLVNRMIVTTKSDQGPGVSESSPVPVYVVDPNAGNTIQYYLDKQGERAIHVETVNDLSEPQAVHSWVALIRYKHETQPSMSALLQNRGYRVDATIEGKASGHSAILLQVTKSR